MLACQIHSLLTAGMTFFTLAGNSSLANNRRMSIIRAVSTQTSLFPDYAPSVAQANSSTFTPNMSLPVHRWFRYSAGFSAEWAQSVIQTFVGKNPRVFDPFAGSGTTLLAAEKCGSASYGLEAHPFVYRVARTKLHWRSDPELYRQRIDDVIAIANAIEPAVDSYPSLIRQCYDSPTLERLDVLRRALHQAQNASPQWELCWLTMVSILRKVSKAGTAQWQYILPKKSKRAPHSVERALRENCAMFYEDMRLGQDLSGPHPTLLMGDARTCEAVPNDFADLVITSPPYPNNYDYADATRLEMSFFQEIKGWGDLQDAVRKFLIRSCSQHVPESAVQLNSVLKEPELEPIRAELSDVCEQLARIRESKGGRKTYHLMIACYFRDLAQVWCSLRRVCAKDCTVCFVIGDSAPYGVYVPVVPWLGKLAVAAGFKTFRFDKTRDRNIKWKNRKHRVPLQEGRLWVEG